MDIRRAAILALGKLADPAGRALVLPALQDSNLEVRLVAIEVAKQFGGKETVRALLPLLGEPEPLVRHAVVEALSGMGTLAETALKAQLRTATGWAATAAQEALDRLWREQRKAA